MAAERWTSLVRAAARNRVLDAETAHREADDDTVAVGTLAKAQFARASRMVLDGGVPRFCDEVAIKVYPGQEKRLRLVSHPDRLPTPSWRALDVLTRDAKARGHTLVVTTYPYSTDWFDAAPFKRTLHRGRDVLESYKQAALEYLEGHLSYLRNEVSFDLFETRTGYLTASLAEPERSRSGVATGRQWDKWHGGRIVTLPYLKPAEPEHGANGHGDRERRWAKRRLDEAWVFGICPDVGRARELLEQSATAHALLEATRDRSLLEVHYRGQPGVKARELRPHVVPYAEDVLHSSIQKALCGPTLWEGWQGAPVAELVREIYLQTFEALDRRDSTPPADPEATVARDRDLFFRLLGMAEEWLACCNESEVTEKLEQAQLWVAGEAVEQRLNACVLSTALRRLAEPEDLPLRQLRERAQADPVHDVRQYARYAMGELEQWYGESA